MVRLFWIVPLSFLFVILFFPEASASLPRFQTTRLISTAGAGVASVSLDEATILNPATLPFFQTGALSVQKSSGELLNEGQTAPAREIDRLSFIASDTKNPLKGSVSYSKLDYGDDSQKQLGISLASTIGTQSAMGFTYRKTERTGLESSEYGREQLTVGLLHAVSQALTIGVVVVDPLGKIPSERRGLFGLQYVYLEFISIMLDIGADYREDMADTFTHREAIQIKIFGDFYGRFGVSSDKHLKKRKTGVGIGWVGPKLVLDLGVGNTRYDEISPFHRKDDREKETSFSVSYRF